MRLEAQTTHLRPNISIIEGNKKTFARTAFAAYGKGNGLSLSLRGIGRLPDGTVTLGDIRLPEQEGEMQDKNTSRLRRTYYAHVTFLKGFVISVKLWKTLIIHNLTERCGK